ncbi:hypothetical protein ACFOWB_14690 [Chenggangzhangella methanolivorans]|uniref:hypothetical protein n=1 Tax=Chenggangzhangella methanolivorans TaxID=1437009 RepID=UPI00361C32EF
MSAIIEKLHATFARRETPETVAELVAEALPDADRRLHGLLDKARRGSIGRRFGWSSMSTNFAAPPDAAKQIAKAAELAELFLGEALPSGEAVDSAGAADAADALSALIGRKPGAGFRHGRTDRAARSAAGLELSRRRYTKLFRLAVRLEEKSARLADVEARAGLILVGKAALAPRLALDDLGDDAPTAGFVAYYAARMKLRSEFTIFGQQKPFDQLSEALLALCGQRPEATRWFAVAHVFPREDVLARLTDHEKGRLLGQWFAILDMTAERLKRASEETRIDMHDMIVRQGNDSSTWNLLAGAWNRARDHWIALVTAMGFDELFDEMMPGKVMRLMAGDVAHWHRSTGGGVHPDTAVWRDLPKPWSVLRGDATCTRADIEAACRRRGVDPETSGWSAPRPRTDVSKFRPTPELVHGVAVNNPYLAAYLKKARWFSGKDVRFVWVD